MTILILLLSTLLMISSGRNCPDSSYTHCASEGGRCDVPGSIQYGFVSYGYNGKYVLIPFSNTGGSTLSMECDNDHGDPYPGTGKRCCYKSQPNHFNIPFYGHLDEGAGGWDFPNGGSFWTMRYGANNKYIYRVVEGSIFWCNNQFFNDPVFGTGKHCQYSDHNPPELDYGHYQWVSCGNEGGSCTGLSSAPTWVRYGLNGEYAFRYVISQEDGSIPCNNGFFEDSLPGVGKHCWRATCGRHRRPWLEMSQTDRNLYINGFKKLNEMGITQTFAQSHGNKAPSYHGYPEFLPYHRGLIYKMEDAIRSLGGEYYCFAMPYWEQSHPSARSTLLSSGLDGTSSSGCLSGAFSTSSGYNPYRGSCLLRNAGSSSFTSASRLMDIVDNYGTYDSFWPTLEAAPHGPPHVILGGTIGSQRGHMGDFFYSPDDPIFYLHHCFVDYIWALWQDCSNFDGQSPITNSHYPLANVNHQLEYDPITDDTVRAGDLLDLYPFGVSYEKGGFWGRAHVDSTSNCGGASDPINDDWFRGDTRRRMVNDNIDPRYAECDAIFERLKAEYGDDEHRLMHENAVQGCRCRQRIDGGDRCEVPDNYDDCSDMPINPNTNDIDITLEELLNKRGINECMKRTIKLMYDWAKATKGLLELCIGCYAPFCDTSSINAKCEAAVRGHRDNGQANIIITPDHNKPHHINNNPINEPMNKFMDKPMDKPINKPIINKPVNNFYYEPEPEAYPPPPIAPVEVRPVYGGYYIYITTNTFIIFGLIGLFIIFICCLTIHQIKSQKDNKKRARNKYRVVKFDNSTTDDEDNPML